MARERGGGLEGAQHVLAASPCGAPPHRGQHAASMLMVVRDYIQPLPQGLAEEGGPDLVTPDPEEMVAALRTARAGS